MEAYPNEIMAFTYRPIENLDLSPMTKYFLGWTAELDEKSKNLMFGKKIKDLQVLSKSAANKRFLCNWGMTLKQSVGISRLWFRRTKFCRAVVLNFGF